MNLLKSHPIEYNTRADDNHIFIHTIANGVDYSLAINVQSNISRSRLYYCVKTYHYSKLDSLNLLSESHTNTSTNNISNRKPLFDFLSAKEGLYNNYHIQYFKDHWIERSQLLPAEDDETFSQSGSVKRSALDVEHNHVAALLVKLTEKTMSSPNSSIIAIGDKWGPKNESDWTFGFYPALGLHDIHANDDMQDGAIFFSYPDEKLVIGLFTCFK